MTGGSARPGRQRLAYLDGLRAVGITMVVAHHALGYCLPLSPTLYSLIRFVVVTIGVPIFFLADGYLLARGAEERGASAYGAYVRRSAARLLIPWAIFSALYAALRYVFEIAGLLELTIVGRSPTYVALSVFRSVYAPQMYFLLSLFLLRLLQPASLFLARVGRGWLLVLVVLCTLAYRLPGASLPRWLGIEDGQDPILGALWGCQYYLAGIALWRFERELSRWPAAAAVVALGVAVWLQWNWGEVVWVWWVVQYAYLIGMYLFFLGCRGAGTALSSIGASTMGIYLLHAPVLLKAVSLGVNAFISVPVISFSLIALTTLVVSHAGARFLARLPAGALFLGQPSA